MPDIASALDTPCADEVLVEEIRAAFADVLGREFVAADDDFFDLGGSSMLAISLVLALEDRIGRDIPIAALHEAPSPIALGRMLASAEVLDVSPIVRLRGGPARPALFLIAGLGGTVMELASVARDVDAGGAVYGLQAFGLSGGPPLEHVGAMADAHLASIRSVQPAGPYALAGYSFGGLLAFEVARRLIGLGEEVRFLGLIDTYPDPGFSWRTLRGHLRAIMSATAAGRREAIERTWRRFAFRLRVRLGVEGGQPMREDGDVPPVLLRVRTASNVARQRYRPTPCACDATFFQAVSTLDMFPKDPLRIWKSLVPHLTLVRVPGDHYSMLRSGGSSLAAALTRSLRDATRHATGPT